MQSRPRQPAHTNTKTTNHTDSDIVASPVRAIARVGNGTAVANRDPMAVCPALPDARVRHYRAATASGLTPEMRRIPSGASGSPLCYRRGTQPPMAHSAMGLTLATCGRDPPTR